MTKEEILADEVLMIRDGGEMPEVALNASLYYLMQEKDGPQLSLAAEDFVLLKQAVIQRFCFIILRDLQPENRAKTIYRGLERSWANWFRLVRYCRKEQMSLGTFRQEVAEHLGRFLKVELHDVCDRGEESCINCTRLHLEEYAESLGGNLDELARGWQKLF